MKYLFIILLTLLSVAAADCTKSKSPEEQAAYAASQATVQQQLSIPGGATFPDTFEADKSADGSITINAYVDARNAQGSIIRHKYMARLKYRSGDKAAAGSWSVEDLSFD